MDLQWVRHLKNPKDKEDFIGLLRVQLKGPILNRLREILITQEEMINSRELNAETYYDNPSWHYLQAHMNGRRQEIQYVLNLIKELDKTNVPVR